MRKNLCPVSYNVNIIHLVINTFISTSTKNYIKTDEYILFYGDKQPEYAEYSNRITFKSMDKKICQFLAIKIITKKKNNSYKMLTLRVYLHV